MSDKLLVDGRDVLLIVDVQKDFCPGGNLAVPQGDEVIPIVNQLARKFSRIILAQDWHPPGHISFASSHRRRKPFDIVEVAYGNQELWPDHCIQGTNGADFHPDLYVPNAELILRKGFKRQIDSYSIFFENDRETPTGLGGYLRECNLTRVFLAGLAFDFCVRFSAEDAHRMGFEVVVADDACRAIDTNDSLASAIASLQARGIPRVSSTAIECHKAV